MQKNWSEITSLAYLTLLQLNIDVLPVPVKKIKCKDVIITSYQNYSEKSGLSISDITCGHELDDAFLLSNLRPGLQIILYNKLKYGSRLKHTLLHEVGHIKCGHKKHGEQEEIEAHFFAAQANAPNIIINELNKRGYTIKKSFLMEVFGLSEESSQKKMNYIGKYGFTHKNEYDDLILHQFMPCLDSLYPAKFNHYYDDYFDDMEKQRENW